MKGNGSRELARDAPKLRSRNKVQKAIQAKNDEAQATQAAGSQPPEWFM